MSKSLHLRRSFLAFGRREAGLRRGLPRFVRVAGAAAVAVALVHTEAWAQQAPASAPSEPAPTAAAAPSAGAPAPQGPESGQQQPAPAAPQQPYPPGPPPGYGQPYGQGYGQAPGGYGNYPMSSPAPYYPPAPPDGIYRPFSFTFGFGPSLLALNYKTLAGQRDWSSSWGIGYNVRLGIGLIRNVDLTLDFIGTTARKDGLWSRQDAFLIGARGYFAQRFYLRGSVGFASVSEERPYEDGLGSYTVDNGPALALGGGAGVELIQAPNVALAFEINETLGFYDNDDGTHDRWSMTALQLVFSFF